MTIGPEPISRMVLRSVRFGMHSVLHVIAVPGISIGDALAQPDARPPAEGGEAGDVEELARGAVGLAAVELESAPKADHVGHDLRQLGDGEIRAGADVEEAGPVP